MSRTAALRWLTLAPSYLAAIALFALMAMTFLDVILRSAFDRPLGAGTELTRLLMAVMVFSALPVISWRGGHIVVDLLDHAFAPQLARLRDVSIDLISGVALLWPGYRVVELAARARDYGDTTEFLHIPQFYIGYFIALSTLITAAALVVRAAIRLVRPGWLEPSRSAAPGPD